MKKVIYVLTVLLVIGILAGCNSTDVPTVPETDSNTADTSVATDIGKTAAAEVGSNSAQITEKAPGPPPKVIQLEVSAELFRTGTD
ncbi:MAG: hypothetical protein ACLUFM_00260 [Lachnospiraceae bacterium]